MRLDRIQEVTDYYKLVANPEPVDVAVGNDKDALRQKYENVLRTKCKGVFVCHTSPRVAFMEDRGGGVEQRNRVVPDNLREFADEIEIIMERCPLMKNYPSIYDGDDGLTAEWYIEIPYTEETVQGAVEWLAQNMGAIIKRDVMQEAILGKQDYGLDAEQRIEMAKELIEYVGNEGMAVENGPARAVARVADINPDMLDVLYPIKNKKPYPALFPPNMEAMLAAIQNGRADMVARAAPPAPPKPQAMQIDGGPIQWHVYNG